MVLLDCRPFFTRWCKKTKKKTQQCFLERMCGVPKCYCHFHGKKIKSKLFCFFFSATFWCKKSVMPISTSHIVGSHPASCEGGKSSLEIKTISSPRLFSPAGEKWAFIPQMKAHLWVLLGFLRATGSSWMLQFSENEETAWTGREAALFWIIIKNNNNHCRTLTLINNKVKYIFNWKYESSSW